jgi:hypothetical protein
MLCFALRLLTVLELLYRIAVDLEELSSLNRQRLLASRANDLKEICPRLIDFGVQELSSNSDNENLITTVRIAHFSVQEYLKLS